MWNAIFWYDLQVFRFQRIYNVFFSLYQDVAFGYKKLISDPDVLALIFETLAGYRITEKNMNITLCWS